MHINDHPSSLPLLLIVGDETRPASPDSNCFKSLKRAAASLILLNSMQKA